LPFISFRFLWRPNATFAISRHYRRFDVFVEAEANKAAGKYENSSIDNQIRFYKLYDGLTHYSRDKLPITSGRNFFIHACICKMGYVFTSVPVLAYNSFLHLKNLKYCLWLSFCRCSWRVCYHKRAHSNYKSFYLLMVQRSRSLYFQGSIKLFHSKRQNNGKNWLEN